MYVVDSYALIEWFVEGNQGYKKYFEELEQEEGVITKLTLLEFYHRVYHKKGKTVAENTYNYLRSYFEVPELDDEIIKEAGEFRSKQLKKGKSMSYADCVKYVTGKKFGMRVLTGDEDFRDLDNVEFVK